MLPNAELSRSRRTPSIDEASEQRISHRNRKQEGRWLSARASGWPASFWIVAFGFRAWTPGGAEILHLDLVTQLERIRWNIGGNDIDLLVVYDCPAHISLGSA